MTETSADGGVLAATLDADIVALRDRSHEAALAPLVEITPAQARERVSAGDRLCSGGPTDVDTAEVVADHDGHRVAVRVYEAADATVTLVYAHGGGWVTGDLEYSDELCRFVASGGVRVVSVGYRLAPENPFPAAVEDMRAATLWAAGTYGKIGVGGDSAGGNLAAAAAVSLLDHSLVSLAFQVLIYPVLDTGLTQDSYVSNATAFPIGAADMRWFLDHYVETDPRDVRVAPLRAASLVGLPPTQLVIAGHDPLRDEALEFAQRLTEAGVPVTSELLPSLCHGFLRFTAASSGARAARGRIVARVLALAEETAR